MSLDSDVVLFGTGIAPLVAAYQFINQGKSVLLLNPDLDFFLEDSEFPLDPMVFKPDINQLKQNLAENALAELRPEFPGAIEFWAPEKNQPGFHDLTAPHIRKRGRLWVTPTEEVSSNPNTISWDEIEEVYVEALDSGMNPSILEGLRATRRFLGLSTHNNNFRGLHIPGLYDLDVVRYRNGLLEYMREKLESNRMLCSISQLEWTQDGLRFMHQGQPLTSKIRDGMLVFWTPRMSSWILGQAKKFELTPELPKGLRHWEQWSILSRDVPDPGVVGIFGDTVVWLDFEGSPPFEYRTEFLSKHFDFYLLTVLRAGSLITFDPKKPAHLLELNWTPPESFFSLSSLCHRFFQWDNFTIRKIQVRAVFEWKQKDIWKLNPGAPQVFVVPGSDGPILDVVKTARTAAQTIFQ